MRTILYIIIFCSTSIAFGQISFYKQFTNNGYDFAEGVAQTEDSSYLITGSSSSFGEGPAQVFLLKVDSLGTFKWSRNYGGLESDGGKRVMYIENDGILIAGFTNSFGNGAYDFYLTKTDVDGNQLWENTFGTESWDRVNDAALTRDSGVIMIGETLNTLDGESDILIVKTDKDGNQLWMQQIGGLGRDVLNCIQPLDDSTFVVGGSVFVADSNFTKGLAIKIEDNGTIWWQDTLGVTGSYEINDIALDTDRIDYVGMQIKPTGDTADFYLKTHFDGLFDYEFNVTSPGPEFAIGIVPFGTDKFVVVTQVVNPSINNNVDHIFFQFYPLLYFESVLAGINNVGDEFMGQIIPTSDKGAIAVGRVTQAAEGGSNAYVLKLIPGQAILNSYDYFSTEPLVSILDKEMENNYFNLYPNPTDRIVQIDFTESSFTGEIILYNQLGQVVLSEKIVNFQHHSIDLGGLEAGVYRLSVVSNNGVGNKSLLLK